MKRLLTTILLIGTTCMTQAAEWTNKEIQEFNQLKYGPDYLVTTTLPVTISETVKLQPDMVTFSVKLLTESDEAKTAFESNAQKMTQFRQFLTELKIKDDQIKTLSYRNYEQLTEKKIPATDKTRYRSTLIVTSQFESKQFFDVVSILENYDVDVSNLKSSSTNTYIFTIAELNESDELAKSKVKERFAAISEKLRELGIKQIIIGDYKNDTIYAQDKIEHVKKYFVDNTLQIKLYDFDLIGKILMKLLDLDMTMNNDMVYSLSEAYKDKIIQQHQAIMFKKMLDQAETYLGNNQNGYLVGNLISFQPNLDNIPATLTPRANYAVNQEVLGAMDRMKMQKSVELDLNKIIQAPAEYDVILRMSGVFEVLKQRYKD